MRFIDDVFFIWPHGQEGLSDFITKLNSAHPTIKFTSKTSRSKVSYLDLRILLQGDDTLKTSLFVKPTDSGSYLHFESAHPRHCIHGIYPKDSFYAYVEFAQIRKNSSTTASQRVNTSCAVDTRSLSWGWLSLKPITGTNSLS